ncbi:hypothetical protein llap_4076 [Limosa lapponica baueri]|uniref:Uncharacterized protein n=1 Tax=Limosa lapponica baueri TaxID=1758121 RepID=A0A2I0UHZ9_LIMLA|nr:hypothetical protein llap_4076 [Limosa lapponica baueri]
MEYKESGYAAETPKSVLYSSFVLLKEKYLHKSKIEDGIKPNEIAGFDKIAGTVTHFFPREHIDDKVQCKKFKNLLDVWTKRKGTASFLLPEVTGVTDGDGLSGFQLLGFGGTTPVMEWRADGSPGLGFVVTSSGTATISFAELVLHVPGLLGASYLMSAYGRDDYLMSQSWLGSHQDTFVKDI